MAEAKRCAVYTRKSSEEGLDQQFNSLHAQREACEAYILSQKHEGWTLVPTSYDDGGHSGGTMQRPALQALLGDVRAGKIDIIVVYKVDRLTRSLADFAKIVEVLDAASASFVSVTQAFNTTTSMGRLTLNVLLSFAQFEREVTGERIRDKFAASKAKGMWMGGLPPLGYDAANRLLVVNEAEAADVRQLFGLYRELGSADAVVEQAELLGIRSKRRVFKDGRNTGGTPILRGALYSILQNPIYVGEIAHKGKLYRGLHSAIIDRALFDEVQKLIAANRRRRQLGASTQHPSLLAGLITDAHGRKLTPTHTAKGRRRYRYYALPDAKLRIPARDIEALVVQAICERLMSPEALASDLLTIGRAEGLDRTLERGATVASLLGRQSGSKLRARLLELVEGITVNDSGVAIRLRAEAVTGQPGPAIAIVVPARLMHARRSLALVLPGPVEPRPDRSLITCVAQGRVWYEDLASGAMPSMKAIAERDGVDPSYVGKLLDLAFLAPDIVETIVEGRQPPSLTAARLRSLCPLPADFAAQRALLLGDAGHR